MKRTAAILGPTPAFLSWTIVQDCSLRSGDARKPVDAAFRELRSLRALAVGEIEQRVFEGFCLHPDAAEVEIDQVKGFPVVEIYAALGGESAVRGVCQGCVANVGVCAAELESAGSEGLSKSGCFGWLPFGEHLESANQFLRLLESDLQQADPETQAGRNQCPVEAFEGAFEDFLASSDKTNPFPATSPKWFGVWSRRSFSGRELEFLAEVCSSVRCDSLAWRRLAAAIDRAHRNALPFHCQLTPAGHSDGVNWVIESQCVSCGSARSSTPCPVCGDDSKPTRSRKLKVLGLRPYLKLSSIVGDEGVAKLVEHFRK